MLTIKKIESSKPKDKAYKVADTGGLYVDVSPTGNKSFRFDYKFIGKFKTLTIGKYPYISLQETREESQPMNKK